MACDPADASRAYSRRRRQRHCPRLCAPSARRAFCGGPTADITCMAVSRSGRFMATGQCGMNADVRVWDLATGTCVHVLSEHDEGVACVAFSLDERLLASCGRRGGYGKLFVWDVETGAIVANGPCEPRDARAVAFSPVVVQGVFCTWRRAGADVVIYGIDAGEGKMAARSAASATPNARTAR